MERFTTEDGVGLAYERRGVGPRVYVCNGGPANDHRYLADDLEPLTDSFEFVFHDYRGSGASENADRSTYTLDRLARDLDELRSEVGDEQITVLAHSMGGFVALAFALRFPDRCSRLILAGTWPTNVPRDMMPGALRALGWARSGEMVERAVSWLVADSWRHRSHDARRRLYAIWSTMQEGRPDVRAAEAERERRLHLPLDNDNVRPLQRLFITWDLTGQLQDVRCPVLLLYGSRDAAAVAGSVAFMRHLPQVAECRLPEIGHDPFFEDLTAAKQAIESFVASTPG
jgi:pimeloyl-ACP methyl ester carboxylesterase